MRFIWLDDDGQISVWRLKRVPFGVNWSPFLLNATIQHHLKLEKEISTSDAVKVITLMQSSFYVDDCLSSLSSERQVCEFQQTSCYIMKNAGMELRKWRGNVLPVLMRQERTLGLIWDIETDCMSIAANFPVKFEEWT